jgi:hypothetical protein
MYKKYFLLNIHLFVNIDFIFVQFKISALIEMDLLNSP